MAIRIPLEIVSGNSGKAVSDVLAIQAAIQKTAQESGGIRGLAEVLGITYKEAKRLSEGLGLTAGKATEAVQMLRQLNAVNADSATKYQILSTKVGLTADQFNKLDQAVGNVGKTGKGIDNILQGIGQGAGQLIANTVAVAASSLPSLISSSTLQFEKFRTVLNTLYGDQAKAEAAFAGIKEFAAKTPFQLDEVVDSFLKLKNRGIEPSNDALTKLGDFASSQSKSLGQITSALLAATTGELEQIRGFGVEASSAGDKVTFSFKGLTQTVANTPEAVTAAILKFGELKGVAGGMEAQSKTLGGQLSNLQDATTQLATKFGDELLPVLIEFVKGINAGLPDLENFVKMAGKATADGLKLLGGAIKFVADNGEILKVILEVLILRMVAIQALAFFQFLSNSAIGLIASAVAAGRFSAALAVAQTALKGFVASGTAAAVTIGGIAQAAALAVLPLAALGFAVAATNMIKNTQDMKNYQRELDAVSGGAKQLGDQAIATASKLKAINEAREKGTKFSGEDIAKQKQLLNFSKQQLADIQKQIDAAKAMSAPNPELAAANESLIKDLEASKSALEGQTTALEKGLAAQAKAAETTKSMVAGIKDAATATKALDTVLKDLSLGKLTETEAIELLEKIKNNANAGAEAQKKAADEIVKIRQDQIAAEIEAIKTGQAQVEALQAQGRIGEEEADKRMTGLKVEEVKKQIAANKEAINAAEFGSSNRAKLVEKEKQLLSEQDKIQAEFAERQNKRRLQDFDEQRKILEGNLARGMTTQQEFNEQAARIDEGRSLEEIRQLEEKFKKLSDTDKEGQEGITAQLGEAYKRQAEIRQQAQQREIALVEQKVQKIQSVLKDAEVGRQVDIQKLLNAGVINTQQADQQRTDSALTRVAGEYKAELEKYEKLKSLPSLTNPADEAARQKAIRDQYIKTGELALQ
ncbi:MAG: hypothetical protein WCA35_02765, partial [Kovacikia sp.]